MDKLNDKLSKLNLGQFYTTHAEDIIQFDIPVCQIYIEPFSGQKHLVNVIRKQHPTSTIEMYDILPSHHDIIQQDTLHHPPSYKNKYVITNPPYRARNKCPDKSIFDKYGHNDLYKCFIQQLINDPCEGFIIIIPSNFWISVGNYQLRKKLCQTYNIQAIRVYEYPTFDDTGISVSVVKASFNKDTTSTAIYIHKNEQDVLYYIIDLENNDYTYKSKVLSMKSEHIVSRWTSKNKDHPDRTNIRIKCISSSEPIKADYLTDDKLYIDDTPKLSARTYLTLVISPAISEDLQKEVVILFNNIMSVEDHGSYYREGSRRRITFNEVFAIVSRILSNLKCGDQ
jgi:hypothetical protein